MKILFSFLLLLFSFFVAAQQVVSGTVTFKNKGIKDVSVTLKDTYDGATTDENGNFSFQTEETGSQVLIFTHPKYTAVEKAITLSGEALKADAELKEKISEIEAVVISAGAIEASDKKRATALLSPIDIYTTAGADGQVSTALNFLPGTQTIGESEGLFIRGGSGTESKIFMDGSLLNNYFVNSVPGIAGRDRFNTSLFKGNIFSSGGYSALYGQALSGILILESIDFPEQSSMDFGVSPIFLNAGFQKLGKDKNHSYGAQATYSNLGLMMKLLKFNTNFEKAPESFGADANFRIKNKNGGIWKYYAGFDTNSTVVKAESLETHYDFSGVDLSAKNTSHNLSFKQKFGKYLLNAGTSYSYNKADYEFSEFLGDNKSSAVNLNMLQNYLNFKTVLERKIGVISAARAGIELNYTNEKTTFSNFGGTYNDLISSLFAETDLGFSNNFSAKIGLRAEHSSFLSKNNIAPRFALAYRIAKDWTTSLAYGIFYQNPESRYLAGNKKLDFQQSQHFIWQLQRSSEGRSLRLEMFYKDYDNLIKTSSLGYGNTQQMFATGNSGNGFAKGAELFWRDKKSLKNIDYWISYSYLDTKRNFLNYPVSLVPNFASEHTLSVVGKKFIVDWKTGFNASFTYAKGRPFYDIISENGQQIIRHEGHLKDYSSLNLSMNYLPNLGKKDSKAFTVLVLSVSNVLGRKNIFGYNFSADGMRSSAVVPPINTFVFLGAFISFGVDKTQDAINNNL